MKGFAMMRVRQAIVSILLLCTAQPIMAEKIRKMEVIVTDTERLTEGKIRLNLDEIAAQLAPYQSAVDLSNYCAGPSHSAAICLVVIGCVYFYATFNNYQHIKRIGW